MRLAAELQTRYAAARRAGLVDGPSVPNGATSDVPGLVEGWARRQLAGNSTAAVPSTAAPAPQPLSDFAWSPGYALAPGPRTFNGVSTFNSFASPPAPDCKGPQPAHRCAGPMREGGCNQVLCEERQATSSPRPPKYGLYCCAGSRPTPPGFEADGTVNCVYVIKLSGASAVVGCLPLPLPFHIHSTSSKACIQQKHCQTVKQRLTLVCAQASNKQLISTLEKVVRDDVDVGPADFVNDSNTFVINVQQGTVQGYVHARRHLLTSPQLSGSRSLDSVRMNVTQPV